jgi:outer membrane receptor protein involved in Fe transport
MKKLILILVAVIATMTSAGAQNLKVKGTVRDAKTGEALPFVNVGLMRTTDTVFVRGAATDMQGRFEIQDVKPGEYLMQASCVGYESYSQDLKVVKDIKDIKVELKGGTLLETVEISAEKPLYQMDGEKNMYNTKEDVSIQTGTASDALQNAPGVEVDAEGNITLRGVSSVEIWINDRPSHMNEEALKQYIKQLPANAIERIEVITNPSARYSTSGGVINIVTNQKITRNELLCVGVRSRTTPSISPWISYVWANEKVDFNFYLNGDYSRWKTEAEGTSTLRDANGDTSRYQAYSADGKNNNIGGYAGINLNWNIDSKTHLSTWAGVYPYWGRGDGGTTYRYFEYLPTLTDLGYQKDENGKGFGWGGYLGTMFEHHFDTTGRKVNISLNGNTWNQRNVTEQTWVYNNPAIAALARNDSSIHTNPTLSVEVSYTHPMKNDFELELGVETEMGGGSQYKQLDSLAPSGSWASYPYRSYEGVERGTGLNGYVTLQKRWGGFTVKLGLRGEQAWKYSKWNYLDGSGTTEVDTSFFGLVPSIHLSYQTPTFSSYSLSYTRRYSAPGMTQLSTFRQYDEYSFSTGNPALLVSYTHNIEAAYNKYVMGFGNIGLNAYFRANTDAVGSMVGTVVDPRIGPYLVNYTYPVNIGSSHTEGVEANITYRPSGFFNVRMNASLFNYAYEYDNFSDSKVSYSFRVNVWAKLWGWLEVFANGHYGSPTLGLYSMSVENKGIDLGVSSDFFDRQLSVFINANDIFGWAQWGTNTTHPSYNTTGSTSFNMRSVSLGLTWRIGKMELESKARQGAANNTPNM